MELRWCPIILKENMEAVHRHLNRCRRRPGIGKWPSRGPALAE
jgi:hypothetical protein